MVLIGPEARRHSRRSSDAAKADERVSVAVARSEAHAAKKCPYTSRGATISRGAAHSSQAHCAWMVVAMPLLVVRPKAFWPFGRLFGCTIAADCE